eukprot:m.61740 g.61740  ORF g.61740 m.61740 type:complete len:374 (-) comp23024_c0_seq1:291-1412(-)
MVLLKCGPPWFPSRIVKVFLHVSFAIHSAHATHAPTDVVDINSCQFRLNAVKQQFQWGDSMVENWIQAREELGLISPFYYHQRLPCEAQLEILSFLQGDPTWLPNITTRAPPRELQPRAEFTKIRCDFSPQMAQLVRKRDAQLLAQRKSTSRKPNQDPSYGVTKEIRGHGGGFYNVVKEGSPIGPHYCVGFSEFKDKSKNQLALLYRRVYKTANNAICDSLDQSVLKMSMSEEHALLETLGVTRESLAHKQGFGEHTYTFSSVRDPISHFISGYTEIQHRADRCWRDESGKKSGYKQSDPLYTYLRFPRGSRERALAFINEIAMTRAMHSCSRFPASCVSDAIIGPTQRCGTSLYARTFFNRIRTQLDKRFSS